MPLRHPRMRGSGFRCIAKCAGSGKHEELGPRLREDDGSTESGSRPMTCKKFWGHRRGVRSEAIAVKDRRCGRRATRMGKEAPVMAWIRAVASEIA